MAKVKGHVFSGLEPYKLMNVQLTDRKLGHGSYATVVELKYMGLKCAGKIIHQTLIEQGDGGYIIRKFEEECQILSRVRHPNIVQFLGVYFKEKEKVPMLVMEFLPMNLTSCIEKHGILPEERSYSILHDVALGLCYLHSQSPPIIHRDLSSNNVLLTHNMDAKISDLGVATMLNLSPLQVSLMKDNPGNLAYMPPQVMVANPKYDTSVDVFSFGILMIHTLSGQWPEPGPQMKNGGKIIPSTEAERRKDFLQIIGSEHPLMELILKCIDNDPKQRSHASEIKQKLSELILRFPPKPPSYRSEVMTPRQTTQLGDMPKNRLLRPGNGQTTQLGGILMNGVLRLGNGQTTQLGDIPKNRLLRPGSGQTTQAGDTLKNTVLRPGNGQTTQLGDIPKNRLLRPGNGQITQAGDIQQKTVLRPGSGIPQKTKTVARALSYQDKRCSLESNRVNQSTAKSGSVMNLRKRFQPHDKKMVGHCTGSLGRLQSKVQRLHKVEPEEYNSGHSKSDDEGYTSEINQEPLTSEDMVGKVNHLRRVFQSSNQKVLMKSTTGKSTIPKETSKDMALGTKTKFQIQKQPTKVQAQKQPMKFQVQKQPKSGADEKSAQQSKRSFRSLSLRSEGYTSGGKPVSPQTNDVDKVGKVMDLRKVFQSYDKKDEIFTLGSGTGTHPANVGKTLHLQKQFQSCELKGATSTTGRSKLTSSSDKVSAIPQIRKSFHAPDRKLWTKPITPDKSTTRSKMMPMNGTLRATTTSHVKNQAVADNESTSQSKIKVNGFSQQAQEERTTSMNNQGNQSTGKAGNVMHLRKGFEHQTEKDTASPTKGVDKSMVELEEWYFGNIECILAASKCKEDGDFLVRYSVGKKQYVITCRWKGYCRHYIIQEDGSGNYFNKSGVYQSVKELIDYHTENGAPLSSAGDILMHPVSKYDRWTIQQKDIVVEGKKMIGGYFGEALNRLTGQKVTVKSYAGDKPKSINEFQLEAEVLKRCFHPNIVRLVGLCVDPSPKTTGNLLYIVIEHMPEGNYLHFLKERGNSISKKQLCRMCTDVCKGLEYIHTRLLRAHCDVGAKSCLVGEHEVVKVSNLGNSMCFYDRCEYKQIPRTDQISVRWNSPETINGKRYLQSDVWSFGVLLWETFSEGKTPYPGLDDDTVLMKVKNGHHLDPPEECPEEVSEMMLECWKNDPKQRPSFTALLHKLQIALLMIKSQKTRV